MISGREERRKEGREIVRGREEEKVKEREVDVHLSGARIYIFLAWPTLHTHTFETHDL